MADRNGERGVLPRICYCLSDDGEGQYARMLLISAKLLKVADPQRQITILADSKSICALADMTKELSKIGELIELEVPQDTAKMRSRWLKTQMRNVLNGDFIYLDTDALPIRRLAGLQATGNAPLAAARERFPPSGTPAVVPTDWMSIFSPFGLVSPTGFPIYNSGVMYMADTDDCRRLAHSWHRCWKLLSSRGFYRDQHALTWAIKNEGIAVSELSPAYNAIVHLRPQDAIGARILHFVYDGGNCDGATLLDHLMSHFEVTGKIDWDAVQESRRGKAWRNPGESLKRAFVMRDLSSVLRIVMQRAKDRWRTSFSSGMGQN